MTHTFARIALCIFSVRYFMIQVKNWKVETTENEDNGKFLLSAINNGLLRIIAIRGNYNCYFRGHMNNDDYMRKTERPNKQILVPIVNKMAFRLF